MEENSSDRVNAEFMGRDINLNDITNPHLKRVIEGRAICRGDAPAPFIEDSEYNDWSRYSCHTRWSQYNDYRVKYSEYGDWNRSSNYNSGWGRFGRH